MKFDKDNFKSNKILFIVLLPLVALMFFVDNKYVNNDFLNGAKKDYEQNLGRLQISEIMASNKGAYIDEFGDCYDWVEIYNGTNQDINLKNYGLSDTKSEKVKWLFPDVEIKSKDYMVIFLTKMNKDGLYASFSLKSEGGENLVLRSPSGEIIDKVKTINVPKNNSMVRDSNNNWTNTIDITPGYSNDELRSRRYY